MGFRRARGGGGVELEAAASQGQWIFIWLHSARAIPHTNEHAHAHAHAHTGRAGVRPHDAECALRGACQRGGAAAAAEPASIPRLPIPASSPLERPLLRLALLLVEPAGGGSSGRKMAGIGRRCSPAAFDLRFCSVRMCSYPYHVLLSALVFPL